MEPKKKVKEMLVRLPDDVYSKLQAKAEEMGVAKAALVKQAIFNYVQGGDKA